MAALKLNTEQDTPFELGQIFYQGSEGWSIVAGIYKTMVAMIAIDQKEPRLYYHNKYPPFKKYDDIELDYLPVIVRNPNLFKIGDYIYFVKDGEIKHAFMGFHCGSDKISIEYEGRFLLADKKYFFKVMFI